MGRRRWRVVRHLYTRRRTRGVRGTERQVGPQDRRSRTRTRKEPLGNGFAGECLRALTELSLDRLNLELVATGYESGNERSERAVEKFVDAVGGQYDGVVRNRTPVGDAILDHHRYTVTREQYRNAVAD